MKAVLVVAVLAGHSVVAQSRSLHILTPIPQFSHIQFPFE